MVARTYVYLRVVSYGRSLEELVSLLGTPDSGWSRGDTFESGKRRGVRTFSTWELHAQTEGCSLDEQLAELFPRVDALTNRNIQTVNDVALTLEIVQYLDPSDSATLGLVLDHVWLRTLAALSASVDVDQYLAESD